MEVTLTLRSEQCRRRAVSTSYGTSVQICVSTTTSAYHWPTRTGLRSSTSSASTHSGGDDCRLPVTPRQVRAICFPAAPAPHYPRSCRVGPIRTRFLLECLEDLRTELAKHGQRLLCLRGPSARCFQQLCGNFNVSTCFAFSEVCSEEQRVERSVGRVLESAGARLQPIWGFTLYHIDDLSRIKSPWHAKAYRSYTAFRQWVQDESSVRPEAHPPRKWQTQPHGSSPVGIDALPTVAELCGTDAPPVDDRAPVEWVGGERAALAWLHDYIWVREALAREYVGATNTMSKGKIAIGRDSTSKLSPWLAHGALSVRRLFHEVERYERQRRGNKATAWMKHELVWRDYLRFACLAWRDGIFKLDGIEGALRGRAWLLGEATREPLQLWVSGRTGYPFVDCFMRELQATGYSHRRPYGCTRACTRASAEAHRYTTHCGRECACWFLVRDLGVDWRCGAEYFESILIDYEPSANWGPSAVPLHLRWMNHGPCRALLVVALKAGPAPPARWPHGLRRFLLTLTACVASKETGRTASQALRRRSSCATRKRLGRST